MVLAVAGRQVELGEDAGVAVIASAVLALTGLAVFVPTAWILAEPAYRPPGSGADMGWARA